METLKKLRLIAKKTQYDLADFLKCSPATYNRYERGEREPSNEVLKMLADYFNVSVDYLLGRSSDPSDFSDQGVTNLTEEEAHILDLFRAMNEKNKNIYIGLGETLAKDK